MGRFTIALQLRRVYANESNDTPPMNATESAKALKEKFGTAVVSTTEFRGETTVVIQTLSLLPIMTWLKGELAYDFLIDISSIDHAESREARFELVYELYSLVGKSHLRVKCPAMGDHYEAPTVSNLWATADWHEREIYDMMGITFLGHPDLRRILMWDGYPYFPLRKDFPLAGKSTDVPDVAFTGVAPLAGGPFVTAPGAKDRVAAEPRARGGE